ncbi:sensor histidine kinase [Glycomyces terrestris]|uniref:Oxygen sensor histidine kinase NreB n=1 Tax=Glycomyces terrestris TaxID=2493553 RepID=A0A426V0Y0_9ACTN|nr:sensor histidine kinase [Glycomyces terrestris]RRS00510.1 sensor histidine kinase [Glycomyces terrestris]
MQTAPWSPELIGERSSGIHKIYSRFLELVPYLTLAVATALSALLSELTAADRTTAVALSAAAAVWVYFGFTRMTEEAFSPVRMTVYFIGFIAFGFALMRYDMLYFIFVVTGFFHAGLLRPLWMIVTGIGATSVVVNSTIVEVPSVQAYSGYAVIVCVQTLAISFGFLLNDRMEKLRAEREEAFRAREAAMEENAGLHMQLMTQAREAGVLDERQRMAREIHDTVAQGLAGIIAQLQAVDATDDEAQRRRHLDSAVELARDSLAEARRTVQAIGPPTLDAAQLPEALAEVSAKWSAAHAVPVELVTTGEARPMHPEVEVTLLRVTQEALTNAAKHAGAGRIGITLSYMEDELALDVRDDGVGFEPARTTAGSKGGYGLSAMRQRVSRIAGSLSIESEPGRGTVVSAIVPAVPQGVADAA